MNKFGQSHVFKYDVLLMNNNKYLIWKLMFPRIGDTFVSLDKMMDLVTWEGIYKLMEKVTADFGSWAEDDQSISNYLRYKIQIRKIKLDIPYNHLVDVNYELLDREYVMCLYASLNDCENVTLSSSTVKTSCGDRSASETPINHVISPVENKYEDSATNSTLLRKRQNSTFLEIDSSSKKREMESSFSESLVTDLYVKDVKIPQNFNELREIMKDAAVMARFGFDDNNNRFFDNVYTVRDGRCFVAFHNLFIITNMRREEEVKLFFCFSPELSEQFKGIGFEDISQTLIVYVKLFDRVFPFGYFVLENTVRHVFEDIIKTIMQWLKGVSDAGQASISPTVVKCVVPHDLDLHLAIRKYWPNVKLIGCSTQYQREVCEFILKKRTPIENIDSFHRDKKNLINFARALCYLPDKFISTGIDIIEGIEIDNERLIPCKMQLIENLHSKWIAHSISVYNEKSVYRTLQLCTQFNIQIKRELKSEHIFKSIETLKAVNKRVEIDFRDAIKVPTGFRSSKPSTSIQKKREILYWTAIAGLEENLKTMQPEVALKVYMEEFCEN